MIFILEDFSDTNLMVTDVFNCLLLKKFQIKFNRFDAMGVIAEISTRVKKEFYAYRKESTTYV